MKQKIEPKGIRKGDLIRVEGGNEESDFTALEYVALHNYHVLPENWKSYKVEGYYLLDRPEPPFEPYWGMVIGDPGDNAKIAVYVPSGGASLIGWLCSTSPHWMGNEEAKQKLAQGWVVIEKPKGVK